MIRFTMILKTRVLFLQWNQLYNCFLSQFKASILFHQVFEYFRSFSKISPEFYKSVQFMYLIFNSETSSHTYMSFIAHKYIYTYFIICFYFYCNEYSFCKWLSFIYSIQYWEIFYNLRLISLTRVQITIQ